MNPIEEAILLEQGVFALWEQGIRGQGVTVAVIDSGVRDDDPLGRVTSRVDLTDDDDPDDLLGHGTEMTQIIVRYAGSAKVASIKVVDRSGGVTRETVVAALDHCIREHPEVRLINISLGLRRRFWRWMICSYERPCVLCRRVTEVVAGGRIVVAAVGNDGPAFDTITCPAYGRDAYAVGAIADQWFEPPSFVARLLGWLSPSKSPSNVKMSWGTSIAAARASGGIALLLSAFPDLGFDEMRRALARGAAQIDGLPESAGAGHGNFYRAKTLIAHERSGGQYDPDRAAALYKEGAALESYTESRLKFEEALLLAPMSAQLRSAIGTTYLLENKLEQALEQFLEAVRLESRDAWAHNNLGTILEMQGKTDEALDQYRIAWAHDPTLEEAAVNIRRLQSMKNPV